MTGVLVAILATAAALAAAVVIIRANRAERRARHALLDDCVALLDGGRIEHDAAGYGVLKGRYRGVEVALRPFSEALAFRRLPQLWLAASVRLPTGLDGVIDILRRPGASEFYSPGADLPRRLATPETWPVDASLRISAEVRTMPSVLESALAELLAKDRTKNVTLTPRGVRLIVQHREGERGAYLIHREGRFLNARVSAQEALEALDAALAVARAMRDMPADAAPDDALVDAA